MVLIKYLGSRYAQIIVQKVRIGKTKVQDVVEFIKITSIITSSPYYELKHLLYILIQNRITLKINNELNKFTYLFIHYCYTVDTQLCASSSSDKHAILIKIYHKLQLY